LRRQIFPSQESVFIAVQVLKKIKQKKMTPSIKDFIRAKRRIIVQFSNPGIMMESLMQQPEIAWKKLHMEEEGESEPFEPLFLDFEEEVRVIETAPTNLKTALNEAIDYIIACLYRLVKHIHSYFDLAFLRLMQRYRQFRDSIFWVKRDEKSYLSFLIRSGKRYFQLPKVSRYWRMKLHEVF
jgi:hypothetical protein